MSELWRRTQRHRGLVFLGWFVGLSLAGMLVPRSQHLSALVRLLSIGVGMATLLLAASLGAYFIEAWKRQAHVSNKDEYTCWLLFESIVGIPFALGCAAFALAVVWLAVR